MGRWGEPASAPTRLHAASLARRTLLAPCRRVSCYAGGRLRGLPPPPLQRSPAATARSPVPRGIEPRHASEIRPGSSVLRDRSRVLCACVSVPPDSFAGLGGEWEGVEAERAPRVARDRGVPASA